MTPSSDYSAYLSSPIILPLCPIPNKSLYLLQPLQTTMPAIPSTIETTITQTSTINEATSLLKRSSMTNPDKYPLYIFLIIAGCVVGGLIGFSVYTMFYGLDDSGNMKDVSHEQRTYMRETRQRYLNMLAREARRPDMIVPIRGMDAWMYWIWRLGWGCVCIWIEGKELLGLWLGIGILVWCIIYVSNWKWWCMYMAYHISGKKTISISVYIQFTKYWKDSVVLDPKNQSEDEWWESALYNQISKDLRSKDWRIKEQTLFSQCPTKKTWLVSATRRHM